MVIVGDWDKPPYEYLNDQGNPAGLHIDILRIILEDELELPIKFVLKDWGNAISTFERGEADLILANPSRYQHEPYVCSENTIHYNRMCAAVKGDPADSTLFYDTITLSQIYSEGTVVRPGGYAENYLQTHGDSAFLRRLKHQTSKVALMGVAAGDNSSFIWREEPLKWKIRELHLDGIALRLTQVPTNEIHAIGRDAELIYEIDDQFSRMKQRGKLLQITNKWLHPEEYQQERNILQQVLWFTLAALLVVGILLLITRFTHARVRKANEQYTDLNSMMTKALHMGNFHVTEYDISHDRMVNRYGAILPPEGLTLAEFTTHIHPEEREEFEHKMQQILTGRTKKFELNKRWNAGTDEQPNWLIFKGHAIVETDRDGQPAYIINAIHDVTNTMDDNHVYRELSSKYFKLASIPFLGLSFYDKDGWLQGLNDTMKAICGITGGDADTERFWLSNNLFEAPLIRGIYTPGTREEFWVCQHMKYDEICADKYIELRITPLLDEDGEVTCYFVTVIDQTEERLRDHERHILQHEINQSHQLISQYGQKLNYIFTFSNIYPWHYDFSSKRFILSRRPGEVEREFTLPQYLDSLCNDERERYEESLKSLDRWSDIRTVQRHLKHSLFDSESGERWYQITTIPIRNELQQLTGAFGMVYDITAVKHDQQQLQLETERAENSSQQKSMFLASMTHELRTPLNSIVGFSELLGTAESPEERAEMIRIIRSNSDMLLRIISDILEASSEGPDSITIEDVDFASAFDNICQAMEKRVTQAGIQFIKVNPYQSYPTRLDIGRIQQVITNFVTNAVKYTKEGHIKVGYRVMDTEELSSISHQPSPITQKGLYIYCEDTGAGIPAEKQAAVFERFVKLNEFVQGTGLGLAICKSIAERHGGRIGLFSEGEGRGSTFWIWIPCEIIPSFGIRG